MSRTRPHHSRNPAPGEVEIALRWEIDRLRTENIMLKRAQDANREPGHLTPPQKGNLVRKIANMWRSGVLDRVKIEARCQHCHGWTEDQAEAAFEAWAEEWEYEYGSGAKPPMS